MCNFRIYLHESLISINSELLREEGTACNTMYQQRLIIKVEMGKQMSATTAILYYENQFNTEIILAKTHFLC
jgi:hypothetical protein